MRKNEKMIDSVTRRLMPDAIDYPASLRRCSGGEDLPAIASKGDLQVLNRTLIGFFCSVRCPGDIILKTYDLARTLRNAEVTLVGGFQTPMEKDCLSLLLRGAITIVVCPARGMGRMRVPVEWKKPLFDGRLLLLSFFDDDVHRPTVNISSQRNSLIAAFSDRLLITYAEPDGKTEQLCKDALARGKSVFTIESLHNVHLVELGVLPISPQDPSPLTVNGISRSEPC